MNRRQTIIAAHDVIMTPVALLVSFALRWGGTEFAARIGGISLVCAVTVPVAAAAYWAFGLHRSPWRFVSMSELGRIMAAVCAPAAVLVLAGFLSQGEIVVPRTVPVIYWLAQVALLAGPRILYRAYRARRRDRRAFKDSYRVPVLLAGAGDEADGLVRRLRQDAVSSLDPVGLLSPKPRDLGANLHGVPVLGGIGDLEPVMEALGRRGIKPRRLVVTGELLRQEGAIDELLSAARKLGLATARATQSLAQVEDRDAPVKLAPVSIDDLLGRSSRELDLSDVRRLIGGRRVLVTGAGGSIGSELCRQIAAMGPAELMLLDHSELALWGIAKELAGRPSATRVHQHLGSVCDGTDLALAFRRFRPELVFHAAALKHVDIVEAHPVAAAATNTLGTAEVARLAREAGARCAVFISTDKAVDPVSVLGATKRAGELVFAAADRLAAEPGGGGTRCLTVRFGNVLGSSGSVIPLFTEQLRSGGPITVTHPEVERYFMTISEAVTLVLMTAAEGVRGGEASPVYVLDMGRPIRIVDLARRMVRLAGLEPDVDIEIAFTGLRPGERLREALESRGETLRPTTVPGVSAAAAREVEPGPLDQRLARLRSAVAAHDADAVLAALGALVPEYAPVSAGIGPARLRVVK